MEYTDTVEGLQAEIDRLSELNADQEEEIEQLHYIINQIAELINEV